ncbi:class I SAM-dependent methyltransferase [Candidatus Latescibacterota bacterium]
MLFKRLIDHILKKYRYELIRIPSDIKITSSYHSDQPDTSHEWSNPFDILKKKWDEVPVSSIERKKTKDLLKLSDDELRLEWLRAREDITTGTQFQHRGWYHLLYSESMRDKKVMDVGSGFAIDSITFALNGAQLTFIDIVEENLEVVRRLCSIFGIKNSQFHLLDSLESLRNLHNDYDVIMAMGSLHHAPEHVIKLEVNELIKHLKIGGRWLQLAYPITRWEREGCLPFNEWGERTDGKGTPWAEAYDIKKLLSLFETAVFDVVICVEFHNNDFIWFDLIYRGDKIQENDSLLV